MRYDNSLTFNVQYYIENVITKKFAAREKDWNLKSSAESFREFLCASEYVNTLDFVIRRYIQTKHPVLLPCDAELADLANDTNLSWDDEVIRFLAQNLSDLSEKQGAKIEKREWLNYLSGTKSIRERRKAFMVAFTLEMSVEDTLDVLLACDLEPYSARHPLDLVCTFCQKRPGRYTWGEAEAMYDEFLARRPTCAGELNAPTDGMTAQIDADLEKIFGEYSGVDDAKRALVQYMVDNVGEFPAFVKRVQRKDKATESHYYKDMEYFLPGYSMTRTEQYRRLAQYLVVLYPSYLKEKRKRKKNKTDDSSFGYEEVKVPLDKTGIPHFPTDDSFLGYEEVKVPLDKTGIPHFPHLIRSMLINSNLVAKEFDWDSSIFDSGDDEYDAASFSFEQQMRKYWTNYLQHIMAVDRLLTKEDSSEGSVSEHQNYEYFRRDDVLLFLYFLVNGYRKAYTSKDKGKIEELKKLRESDDEFDQAMNMVLKKAEHLFTKFDDTQYAKKVNMLRECFDLILTQMDYQGLYLPSLFDRLFFSMLLCTDSHDLLRMVICQGEYL